MPPDDRAEAISRLQITTFDDALGQRIIETHMWAVREGLRGADAYELFDGYCQRLVIDGIAALASASGDGDAASAMERLRLHLASRPQRHRARAIRSREYSKTRIFWAALSMSSSSGPRTARTIRRCAGAWKQDRSARLPGPGGIFRRRRDGLPRLPLRLRRRVGDRSQGTGIVYSFATDRRGGFSDDDDDAPASDAAWRFRWR